MGTVDLTSDVVTIPTWLASYFLVVVVVVVVDSHIQRIVLATEETTVTQQVSHRPIKCQSRLWSRRGCCCCCHPICCLRESISLDTLIKMLQPGSQQ